MTNITMEKVVRYMKKYYAEDYDTPRKFENAVKRKYNALMELYNMPLVKEMVVKMNWTKNSTYGWNPRGTAYVKYENGRTARFDAKTRVSSGGYDKTIHLLEMLLNDAARQNLYHKRLSAYKNRDGFYVDESWLLRHYGLNRDEGKFAFFTIKRVAHGETYDEYVIKFN